MIEKYAKSAKSVKSVFLMTIRKLSNIFRIYTFSLYEIQGCDKVFYPDDIIFKIASESEFQNVLSMQEKIIKKEFIKNYEHGSLCMIAVKDKVIVGYGWLKENNSMDHFVKVKSNVGYLSRFYVKPEFRGQNIYPRLICSLLEIAKEHKLDRCIIAIQKSNYNSLRGIRKIKAKNIGEFKVVRFLKISINKFEI